MAMIMPMTMCVPMDATAAAGGGSAGSAKRITNGTITKITINVCHCYEIPVCLSQLCVRQSNHEASRPNNNLLWGLHCYNRHDEGVLTINSILIVDF